MASPDPAVPADAEDTGELPVPALAAGPRTPRATGPDGLPRLAGPFAGLDPLGAPDARDAVAEPVALGADGSPDTCAATARCTGNRGPPVRPPPPTAARATGRPLPPVAGEAARPEAAP